MPKGESKSVHSDEFPFFQALLVATRKGAGVTQVAMASALEKSQQYVSHVENGDIRLDYLQLRKWLAACDTSIVDFAVELELRLQEAGL
jgi:transcriptional regulator with XRE-family HTH domain